MPSIMPPRVLLPRTTSMILSFIVKSVLYLSMQCEKRKEINKKRPNLAHFLKKVSIFASFSYPPNYAKALVKYHFNRIVGKNSLSR